MRRVPLLRTVALASLLVGCAHWPPGEPQLTDYFHEYRPGVEALAHAIAQEGRPIIARSDWGNVVKLKEPLPDDLVQQYQALFAEAGDLVSAVTHRDGTVEVQLGNHQEPDRMFLFSYLRNDTRPAFSDCHGVTTPPPCGVCIVDLDSDWYLYYHWYERAELPLESEYEATIEARERQLNECIGSGLEALRDAQ